jgi:hypothetical protein
MKELPHELIQPLIPPSRPQALYKPSGQQLGDLSYWLPHGLYLDSFSSFPCLLMLSEMFLDVSKDTLCASLRSPLYLADL